MTLIGRFVSRQSLGGMPSQLRNARPKELGSSKLRESRDGLDAVLTYLYTSGDMASNHLPSVTIEFLEESASGLRSATVANSPIECLIGSRNVLPVSLRDTQTRTKLDVPGVYLLFGPPAVANDETRRDSRLYIGQADSVADRLDQHLTNNNKQWWRIVVVIRRPDKSPLDLSQCKFLESQLYSLGKKVGECLLMNKNAPQPAFLIEKKVSETKELMDSALVILSALGLNLFETASNSPVLSTSSRDDRASLR